MNPIEKEYIRFWTSHFAIEDKASALANAVTTRNWFMTGRKQSSVLAVNQARRIVMKKAMKVLEAA